MQDEHLGGCVGEGSRVGEKEVELQCRGNKSLIQAQEELWGLGGFQFGVREQGFYMLVLPRHSMQGFNFGPSLAKVSP